MEVVYLFWKPGEKEREREREWENRRRGVICECCGKRIKACSTHDEISTKQATLCPGAATKTLKQVMAELVSNTESLQDGQPGHQWQLRASSFGCVRCWCKLPLRSSKAALEHLTASACSYGRLDEFELQLRTRVHPSHQVWKRGSWLECSRCKRTTREQDGRVQMWMSQECKSLKGQQRLPFGPRSSSS